MAVRAARWALPAAALACLVTACGTSGSTAGTSPAGPSAPASTLPPAEGTLRLLTRQGYAENTWVKPFERSTGCRVEVRYADSAESLRRAASGYSFDVASMPGSVAYAVVQDGSARALNPALVPQRASFRVPFRDPAAGRAGARRYGVSFHALRTRQAGARRFVTFHLLVPDAWTVAQAHRLSEEIEARMRSMVPNAAVFTHIEPISDPASYDDQDLDR